MKAAQTFESRAGREGSDGIAAALIPLVMHIAGFRNRIKAGTIFAAFARFFSFPRFSAPFGGQQ